MAHIGTRFPLDEIFPRAGYVEAPRNHKIHYLIALDQPTASINTLLGKQKNLEAKDPVYGLTPLAVAAMAGNAEVVAKLLSLGANPLPLDKINWTPLHYLELTGNEKIKEMIKTASKIKDLPNLEEMRRALHPRLPHKNDPVALLLDRYNQLTPLTAEEFSRMTKSTYSENIVGSPQGLIDYWRYTRTRKDRNPLDADKERYLVERFLKFRDNLPRLAIKAGSQEIITTCRIPSCGVIGIHGGKIDPLPPGVTRQDDLCRLDELDATEFTNLPAVIGDGIPNCQLNTIQIHGIPYHLMVAFREIAPGEELKIDFGPTHSKKYRHQTFSAETIEFYRKNPVMQLYSAFNMCRDFSPRKLIEAEGIRCQLRYLFSTPFLALELLKQKVIDAKEILKLLKDPYFLQVIEANISTKNSYEIICECWEALEDHLAQFPPKLTSHIFRNLFAFIKNYPIHIVVQGIDQLKNHLPSVKHLRSWGQVFTILKENAEAHKTISAWLKDDEGDDFQVRLALQAVHPRDRRQLIENTVYLINNFYPTKLKSFNHQLAALSISDWANDPQHGFYHLIPLSKLSQHELIALYQDKRPHIEHKYPEFLPEFDMHLRRLIDQYTRRYTQTT